MNALCTLHPLTAAAIRAQALAEELRSCARALRVRQVSQDLRESLAERCTALANVLPAGKEHKATRLRAGGDATWLRMAPRLEAGDVKLRADRWWDWALARFAEIGGAR